MKLIRTQDNAELKKLYHFKENQIEQGFFKNGLRNTFINKRLEDFLRKEEDWLSLKPD